MLSTRWTTFYWIALLTLIVSGVGQVATRGIHIQRDLFSTLPAVTRDPGFIKAQNQHQDQLGRKMIFAVVGENTQNLQKVVAELEGVLQKDFTNIQFRADVKDVEKIGRFYGPYRQQLLTRNQIAKINSTPPEFLVQENLARLYSPLGTLQASQLGADPFGYFTEFLMGLRPRASLKSEDGLFLGEHEGKPAAVLFADIKGDWEDYAKQIEIKKLIETFKDEHKQNQIFTLGLAQYMRAGVERAQIEIATIGIGSLLGATLLLIWLFRSGTPLVVSIGLLLASVLSASLITHLFFGSIHFFTLILGSSIVGMIDDYSFHFFSQRFDSGVTSGREARSRIKRSLVYSFLTTVIGFIFLFATPFPVLKQLGVFAIAGFATAFLIIWTFYQHLPHRVSTYPQFWAAGAQLTHQLLSIRRNHFVVGAVVLVIVSGLLMSRIEFNDDVRQMQSLPKDLKSDEEKIRALLGHDQSQTYMLVRAENVADLLNAEENLQTSFFGISQWLPSESKQRESFQAYQKLKPIYRAFFEKLKVPESKINSEIKKFEMPFKVVTSKEWMSEFSDLPVSRQFLGRLDESYYSVLYLPAHVETARVRALESKNVQVVNLAEDTSAVMRGLRSAITWAAIAGWSITLLTVALLMRLKNSAHIMLAPTLAVVLSLGITYLLTGPLNLFHLLAAVLVFSLGIDYTFFFSDCRDSVYVPTLIAVTAAAVTTGLSFGLMSLSQTAAISGFGVTIAIGIILSLILSPFAVRAQ